VPVFALVFIVVMIIVVFAVDIGKRWWQENEWRRRWKRRKSEED
jgi:hypothetical protein